MTMNFELEKKGRYTHINVNGESARCWSKAEGERLKRILTKASGVAVKPKAPGIIKVSKKIEELATYMTVGFHRHIFDSVGNTAYVLLPGFRRLIGQKDKVISVYIKDLRKDRQDDCRRAFDTWADLGFEYRYLDRPDTAEIIIDDEADGAWFTRRDGVEFTGRKVGGKWAVRTIGQREINVSKEWADWSQQGTILHELGHAHGLGHPGPYNGAGWQDKRIFEADTAKNTVMSYFGGHVTRLGDADKVAIDMIYSPA